MKRIIWLLIALMLMGCNTMEGLNKDLKKGGDQIRKSGEQIGKALKTG
jgi:predicted small secreted protein